MKAIVITVLLFGMVGSLQASDPRELEASLGSLSGQLEGLAAEKSQAVDALPPWLLWPGRGQGRAVPGPLATALGAAREEQRKGLKQILAGAQTPPVKALAILWLLQDQNPEDLALLEPLMAVPATAGPLPWVVPQQRVFAADQVFWESATLGQVALRAAGVLTYQGSWGFGPWLEEKFRDLNSYREWHRLNPVLGQSFDYWSGLLERAAPPQRQARESELKASNPELFARVLILGLSSELTDAKEQEVIQSLKTCTALPRMLVLLNGQELWPELQQPGRLMRWRCWTLDHAEALLGSQALPGLRALWLHWKEGPVEGRSAAWAALACAMGRMDPGQEREVLTQTLSTIDGGAGRLLQALACRFPEEETPLLQSWFARSLTQSLDQPEALAILEGLRMSLRKALPCFRKIILGCRLDVGQEAVVRALIQTALGFQPDLKLPLQSAIHAPVGKSTGPTQEESARALAARQDCLDRILVWLRS